MTDHVATRTNQADAPATGMSTSATMNVAIGDVIVGAYMYQLGASQETVTVSDTAGNTYELGTPYKNANVPMWVHPFACRVTSANASNTVTASHSGSREYRSIVASHYNNGTFPSSGLIVDQDQVDDDPVAANSPLSTPEVTLVGAGIIYGIWAPYGSRSFTPGSGFTERHDSGSYTLGALDQIVTSGGNYAVTATPSLEANISLIALAIGETVGPPPTGRGLLLGVG